MRPGDEGGEGVRGWTSFLPAILLILLPLTAFSNVYENGYHLDDHYRIVGNPELEHFWPPWRHFVDPATSATLPVLVQYRPLLPLTLSVDFAVADALGLERLPVQHAVNLGLHIASSLLFYALLVVLLASSLDPGKARRIAWFAAAWFAVHPVSGVPVNYLCARDLLLMQFFLVCGLHSYVAARRAGRGPLAYAAAFVFFALSILSKTNAVVAPALLVMLELTCFGSRVRSMSTWLRAWPGVAASLGFVVWTRYGLKFSDLDKLDPGELGRAPFEYTLTQARVHLTHYLRNVAWPFRLRPLPEVEGATTWLDGGVLLGAAVIVASLALAWRLRRRAPVASWCIAAYWILFSLTSSFVPLRSMATDYRQYSSLPFLFGALSFGLHALWSRRTAAVVGALLIGYFASTAWWMNRVWRDGVSLWSQSVEYGGTPQAHMNYGTALMASDAVLAEHHLKVALERSPGNAYARINLGILEVRTGRPEQGFATLEQAVAAAPTWGITHHWYARMLGENGRVREAAAASRRAVDLDPRNESYRLQAAHLASVNAAELDRRGEADAAYESAKYAASLYPEEAAYLYQAAMTAYRSARHDEALDFLERLHAIVPSREESLFLEGFLLQDAGRGAEAIERYERFLESEPEHAQARFNLGFALMERERWQEAVDAFERTLEVRPGYTEAATHLERCRRALRDSSAE